ncbi:hypothetical protein MAR_010758 [Mya arenaria]|uniref:DUF4773 domain-containing protein n=1 Tax=Mya arenaria TaxID=6604 RepID=A0ABY7FVY7_MYAAR|nr:hypothetical protein MAR_010758 [Mya arenaria]
MKRRLRPSSTDSVPTNSTADHHSNHREHGIPHNQSNLRLLTVNCCSIRTNRSEFNAALEYIKPDLICGTKSWLKGVKPGKDPDKTSIKSSEIFPPELTVRRNDRSSGVGGGVFTATRAREKHIILVGDFNCPDIDWSNMVANKSAADREVQQALIDLSIEHRLTQQYQRECKKAFKKAEVNHINNAIQKGLEENNSKPFWRYVKSRRQDSVGVAPLKKAGRLVNNGKEKAQILVDQFKSVFTRNDSNPQLPDTFKRTCVNMRWLPEEDVFSVVFTVNGNDVYRTNTALSSRKVEECIPTSGLLVHPTGKICFRLYQIEVDSGQMCADLIGKAIIQGKEEVIKEHFGCFRIGDVRPPQPPQPTTAYNHEGGVYFLNRLHDSFSGAFGVDTFHNAVNLKKK